MCENTTRRACISRDSNQIPLACPLGCSVLGEQCSLTDDIIIRCPAHDGFMGASHSSHASRADSADLAAPLVSIDDAAPAVSSELGLTSAEVAARLAKHGYNEVPPRRVHTLVKLLQKFWGPVPWLIETAAVVSIALGDVLDLAFLLTLLVVNGLVEFIEESKAADAIDALKASLAPRAHVHRDGEWRVVDARELVPDDTILLRLGDVVPADASLCAGDPIEIDQSALTGEAEPVLKHEGELVYQGSVVRRGELRAVIIATGKNSFFGRALTLFDGCTTPPNFPTSPPHFPTSPPHFPTSPPHFPQLHLSILLLATRAPAPAADPITSLLLPPRSVERAGHSQRVLASVARALLSLAVVLVTIIFFVLIFDPAQQQTHLGSPVPRALKVALTLTPNPTPSPSPNPPSSRLTSDRPSPAPSSSASSSSLPPSPSRWML